MSGRAVSAAPPRPWYSSALAALLAVGLLLGGVWLSVRLQSPFPYYGTVYTPPTPAASFNGAAGEGRPYTFSPAGRTTALFFGFTHCPDVCPLTLAYLEKARQRLDPAQRAQFQVVFVSLDPARDTPAALAHYVRFFAEGGAAEGVRTVGVRVPEPQLAALARQYGVSYVRAPLPGGGYEINHTAATFLIDRSGRRRLLWDVTQLAQVDRVARDIREVMR